MSIRIIEIIKEMSIEEASLECLNGAINSLVARRYIDKKEQFAELVGWRKETFNKRISNNGLKMNVSHYQQCWDVIEKTDLEVYHFWERVRRGKEE